MATVTPTLGVVTRVTEVLATVRTWEGAPVLDSFKRLLQALPSDDQRAQLPAALGEALMPLRLSPERVLLAMDIAIAFDLFEASDGVARLLRVDPSAEIAVRAAALATHPGASESLRDLVQLVARSVTSDSPILSRQIALALDPSIEPRSDSERLAIVSLWPGRSTVGAGDPPVIAVAANAGSAGHAMDLLVEVRLAGARVRRLPPHVTELPPSDWLADSAVVVAGNDSNADDWWTSLRHSTVVSTRGSLAPAARTAVLQRVNRVLPRDRRLRFDQAEASTELENPFREIDAFLSGAFRTHEMAFLAGMSRDSIASICRKHVELAPRQFHGMNYWTFPTLVGIRAWNYVRKTTRRRLDSSLAAKFVQMSGQEKAVPVAVTAAGKILMDVGHGSFIDERDQLTSEVFFVADHIRNRFSLGGHKSAPDLLSPSAMTAVNPVVYGGSPTVKDSRVTVDAIDRLARRAISDGMTGPAVLRYVRERFPEIGLPELDDARQVARELNAVA